MQWQCPCPPCHWLLAAAAVMWTGCCQGWLILISMKGIGEMYHQDLEQEHFPPPFILTSEATLTDLIFYAIFFEC